MNMNSNEASGDNRKTYYVNVQSQQLYEQSDIAPYHLVITANSREYERILEQFVELEDSDEWSLEPMIKMQDDSLELNTINAEHDYRLKQLYKQLYNLGTEETKKHIEQMRIL